MFPWCSGGIINRSLLLLILGVIVVLRFLETAWFDRDREQGKIHAAWTRHLFACSYPLVAMSSAAEAILLHRSFSWVVTAGAVILMAARFFLKSWAVASLGKYWSSNVEIRSTHILVVHGPYRYMRHPTYVGNLMDIAALALFLNSYWTLLWALPVQWVLVRTRIRLEEAALRERFGVAYERYCRQTPMLGRIAFGRRS